MLTRHAAGLVALPSFTHGHTRQGSRHPLYERWSGMWARCTNPHSQAFRHYGARGITVCERWRDFPAFAEDMGLPPSPRHSLDRIDNDGHYEPGNVRWATSKEQTANRRLKRLTNGRFCPV